MPFITISGLIRQIDSATNLGKNAEIKPAPLDIAPFNAKYAAPGYFSLPAINNVLPLLYLLKFFGKFWNVLICIHYLRMNLILSLSF